jgi:hypothetical protein
MKAESMFCSLCGTTHLQLFLITNWSLDHTQQFHSGVYHSMQKYQSSRSRATSQRFLIHIEVELVGSVLHEVHEGNICAALYGSDHVITASSGRLQNRSSRTVPQNNISLRHLIPASQSIFVRQSRHLQQ